MALEDQMEKFLEAHEKSHHLQRKNERTKIQLVDTCKNFMKIKKVHSF